MEAVLGRSDHGGLAVKEEMKRVESNGDEEEGCKEDFALKIGKSRHEYEGNEDTKRSSPKQKDLSCSKEEYDHDRLESTRAEMGELTEENQRLKMHLGRIMKDYEALQMQFNNIVQQDQAVKKYSTDNSANNRHEIEETELVSLSLGSFSAPKIKDEKNKIPSNKIDDGKLDQNEKQLLKEDLSLGLNNYKDNKEAPRSSGTDQDGPTVSNPSAASSFEEPKEEAGETWPPSKLLKAKRSAEDEVSQQNQVKRARVCVRARCDTPTINDGCQWRKYGQKIAKGNPCPRAYYRCTIEPSCPVRKQVQRCFDDMSILITTYEGTHNHSLPVSAMAMASTTSAAASMLISGSSTSSSVRPPSTELHGFSTLDNSKWINNKQIYSSPYSSYSPFSSSHPTITLDLTASTPSSNSSSTSPFLNKFSSNSSSPSILPNYPHNNTTLYPSTSLSFGFSDSNTNNIISWNNNINNGFLSYGSNSSTTALLYNLKSQIGSLANLGRQTTSFHASNNNVNYYNNNHPSMQKGNSQSLVQESTIAAATKAITADPTFQSALVAALTSIIGGGGGGGQGSNTIQGGGDHDSNNNVVHQQQFPVSSTASFLQAAEGISGCVSTFLNKTASASNSQPAGNLLLSPNSLSFSASKSASASPGDGTTEQTSS